MNSDGSTNWTPDDEACVSRLTPLVRRACDGAPSAATLMAIDAAAGAACRQRVVLFSGACVAALAALALLAVTAWQEAWPGWQAQRSQQLASVVDDAIFLCTEGEDIPALPAAGDAEDLASRLLRVQGLDAVTTPEGAQPLSPLSTEIQSRNTRAPLAQRCG
jgi:hypothetical protein